MKNYFLLILVILILVSVEHPSIAKPRKELFDNFMSMLSDSGKIQKDQAAKKARNTISEQLSLAKNQQEYINQQLKTNASMRAFNSRFCIQNELNSYFLGDDLRQVCRIIKNTLSEYKR